MHLCVSWIKVVEILPTNRELVKLMKVFNNSLRFLGQLHAYWLVLINMVCPDFWISVLAWIVTGLVMPIGSNSFEDSCSSSLLVRSGLLVIVSFLGMSDISSEICFQFSPSTLLGMVVLADLYLWVMALSCGLLVTQALRLKQVLARIDLMIQLLVCSPVTTVAVHCHLRRL